MDSFVFVNRERHISDASVGYPLPKEHRNARPQNDRTDKKIDPYVADRRFNEHLEEIHRYRSYRNDKNGPEGADAAQIMDRKNEESKVGHPQSQAHRNAERMVQKHRDPGSSPGRNGMRKQKNSHREPLDDGTCGDKKEFSGNMADHKRLAAAGNHLNLHAESPSLSGV